MKINLTWYDSEEGEEIEHSFPAKNEVCSRCEGHGSHLNPSIGSHAYTLEEFNESFDDEGREEYFKRGGIYDVQCEECKGKNVVLVADENNFSAEDKVLYTQYQEYEEQRAQWDHEDRMTAYYESGGYG